MKILPEGVARPEPKVVRIDVRGTGEVTGADIRTPSDVEVMNPEVHIATISEEDATLSIEMTVEIGKGYVLPDSQEGVKPVIGVIPVGAMFTPVIKVNFIVEPTRLRTPDGLRTAYHGNLDERHHHAQRGAERIG